MYMPRLGSACKYYSIGVMGYRWVAPEEVEDDSVFRLKLTTDVPPTTHFSGKLRLSYIDATSPAVVQLQASGTARLSTINAIGMALAVVLSLLLTCWVTMRLRRGSPRVVLG